MGHPASLFPYGKPLEEQARKLAFVVGTKEPSARMTVTPMVFAHASSIFGLANGKAKAAVARRVAAGDEDCYVLPAFLVREATWLLDMSL